MGDPFTKFPFDLTSSLGGNSTSLGIHQMRSKEDFFVNDMSFSRLKPTWMLDMQALRATTSQLFVIVHT